ncbi:zinc carboxypeptidase [Lutibacter oceani]|uniref:Zinc carboxypeptidase n=1 Tax=Lutibacter oceani TaxID=1853311 RepID=A0A3D9RUJ3_9FLAO|nr:M14 metallopeptidase family protein [Lutibacter oceani]REE80365.1 zinc carboxypeptidase [Lutibacter oceani]
MGYKKLYFSVILIVFTIFSVASQDYFLKSKAPFNPEIPSPEAFLGYPIGAQHTRYDLIVAYFNKLAELSDRASIEIYGQTHEHRKLIMLTISSSENLQNIGSLQESHLKFSNPNLSPNNYNEIPIFINLGYGVHGNEPSSSEAAMLVAYTLVASNNTEVLNYLKNAVVFIDPTINPDGRDRHTNWVNQLRANTLVSDPLDAEHNEAWPRGRTNHFWFDLNRDWLLAVNPESSGKLNWYHKWYPNVVTDFHEMGTNSTYFFEPMKPIGSKNPIMPKENYEDLNNLFATFFASALDSVGSFYFTKEAFDGTYPGYGSSYPDLQGGLALLFEQASSRGHIQDTEFGKITFPFTIRNQYISSFSTIKAAVVNKEYLRKYQQNFFKSTQLKLPKNSTVAYEFGDSFDKTRTKYFIDKLLIHKIKVFKNDAKFIVPVNQPQKRMVQTVFETYNKYRDSVFYDASAWSLANFYNMPSKELKNVKLGEEITSTENMVITPKISKTSYAYLLDWDDYNAAAALYFMQSQGIKVTSAFKPFSIKTTEGLKKFNYGTIMIPVSKQKKSSDAVFEIVKNAKEKYNVPVYTVNSGFSNVGIDLGSRNQMAIEKPKVAMFIGEGVSSSEAGEVWHLLDTRIHMPITKIRMNNFNRASLEKYTTIVMVSGNYNNLDSLQIGKLKQWISNGNTLITIAGASKWAIDKKLVKENLTKLPKTNENEILVERLPYVDASENIGRERLGGAIFEVELDITHPLGFGYHSNKLSVYKNNSVYLAPSKNAYSTIAKYTKNPHIDGYISNKNLEEKLKPSASLIVSSLGKGRVIMFADNPNFRGAWYGTNRLFYNALFLGSKISVPRN